MAPDRFRAGAGRGDPRGVLIVAAGGLGDAVLFSRVVPRFAALARPGEPVTVLLRHDAAAMAFLYPENITVEAADFSRLAKDRRYRAGLLERLRDANYRLAISADFLRHPNLDEALIAAAGAAETVAMAPRSWAKYDRALTANRILYDRLYDSGGAHVDKIIRWTNFANWLGGDDAPPPDLVLPASGRGAAISVDGPTVVMQPFSAVREKQSPVGLYEKIIDSLPGDFQVVITGTNADLARNPEFEGLIARRRVTFNNAEFETLAPLLRAASLVVSVDTALMHLAVVMGAPVLCLASAAYVGEIVPYAAEIKPRNVTFLYTPMDCAGCLGDCSRPLEAGMFACVAALESAAAVDAVGAILANAL